MGLIYDQGVDTEVSEGDGLILGAGICFALQSLLHALPGLFHLLDSEPVTVFSLQLERCLCQIVDLLIQDVGKRLFRHTDAFEGAVRDNYRIPVSCRDACKQLLAIVFFEVSFLGDQDVGIRVERVESVLPLQQKMVWHNQHGLVHQPHTLAFHHRTDRYQCLTGPHNVVQQRGTVLDTTPDGVFLVRPQGDGQRRTR
ncbi:hypothetical protein D3C77_354070 [compost metagenome]